MELLWGLHSESLLGLSEFSWLGTACFGANMLLVMKCPLQKEVPPLEMHQNRELSSKRGTNSGNQ